MKVVILAGGLGTRISEESHLRPKPMIDIGGMPILWHIMKHYSAYGYNDFIICLGYKQHMVKEFFADYFLYMSDVTFDIQNNQMEVHNKPADPWKVTLIDTGLHTMTGGRIKRVQKYIGDEPFMLTYGDGVSNVDLRELEAFHRSHGKIATITTVNLAQLKGVLDVDDNNQIISFREKQEDDGSLINGGFMVFNPEIFRYLKDDDTVLEQGPLTQLAEEGYNGVLFVQLACRTVMGGIAPLFIAIMLALFSFTCLISYYYEAETAAMYLFQGEEKEGIRKTVTWIMRIGMPILIFIWGNIESGLAWNLSDLALGSCTWINMLIVLLLSPKVFALYKDYEEQMKAKKDPYYNPDKLCWKGVDVEMWKDINKKYIANEK